MIFEQRIGDTPVEVRVYYNNKTRAIKIDFSHDFYVHQEVVNSLNYYFEKAVAGKKATDYILHTTCDWVANFLNLAFKIGIAKLDAFTGCRKIARGY